MSLLSLSLFISCFKLFKRSLSKLNIFHSLLFCLSRFKRVNFLFRIHLYRAFDLSLRLRFLISPYRFKGLNLLVQHYNISALPLD
jgi:hypothetical protein